MSTRSRARTWLAKPVSPAADVTLTIISLAFAAVFAAAFITRLVMAEGHVTGVRDGIIALIALGVGGDIALKLTTVRDSRRKS